MKYRRLIPRTEQQALARAVERTNAPWRPRLAPRGVDPRRREVERMIRQVTKKIGLLQALRDTLLDSLTEPQHFDRVDLLLGKYTSEHADIFVGLDAARIADVVTDWEADHD